MNLMQTQNLSVRRRGQTLISDLSLNVEPGQCWVLLGRNGCGKSSLLKSLAGIDPLDAGSILLGGDDISSLATRIRARRVENRLQILQSQFNLHLHG